MVKRILAGAALALLIVGCSPGSVATLAPGATAPPGGLPGPATNVPVNPTAQPNAGDVETLARSIVPPGSTETGEFEVGGLYQLHVTSTMTIDQLEAYWAQAIPAQGMTLTGSFKSAGILTIAIANPDGGIVAAPNSSGGVAITISLGTST